MARELAEINAGSMADIAFLLLVFFLVVTTMKTDKGMTRLLPPPVFDEDPIDVRERDVYEVMVNFNNELLVEERPMDVRNLKQGAKNFLLANGDNVLKPLSAPMDDFPIRAVLDRDSIDRAALDFEQLLKDLNAEKVSLEGMLEITSIEKSIKDAESALDRVKAKQYAFEFFGDYAPLPPLALISVQNDNGTDYNTYLTVNNELEAAVRELRDEICLMKFGVKFRVLSPKNEEDKKKILAIREVYPQRISEAESLDVGGFSDR